MTIPNPQTDPDSTPKIDALDRSRRRMIMAVAVTSTLWILPQILRGIFEDEFPRGLSLALVLLGVVSALLYVVFMMRFQKFQTRVLANPHLRERLDDERILEIRKIAIVRGWMTLIVAIGLGVAVAPFVDLPDQVVLLTLMLLGVNVPLISFLVLDRD